ncbi:hypothetical protein [Streptomyces pini]|uniref:Uncharacterized protein n=1 Tax=Streptomyces pini TaxID=1520580 RepID=A0A1I4C1E4_9ACTN|nr:hypothetical protein [Streptomyces pini]SFK74593.1 hypothetical protein SAMN05192584_108210 [Streptomyces pini]
MPYFLVDDGAHSHPKVMRAGNAAFGLWTRVGSYVAQHLTDGHVPCEVVKMYGSAAQAAKLVKVGLWHEHGHTCPRCPQPREGDYYMHDYADSRNPSRVQVEERRAKEVEKKRRQRGGPRRPQQPRLDDQDARGEDPPRREEPPAPPRPPAPEPEPEPQQIPAGWQPSPDDVAVAQAARADAGRPPLTSEQLDAVTRKFVRHMRDKGTRAAGFGGQWQTWAERERPEPGGEIVPFPGARQQQTRGQQQREGLARLLDQTTREV